MLGRIDTFRRLWYSICKHRVWIGVQPSGDVTLVARRENYHLLIADDDTGFRETIRGILEPYFELVEAGSGEEAIEIIEYQPVDIALLDMHMHVLTGLETLRILKSLYEQAPCILVSGDVTEDLCRDAREAEAFSVLTKPVTKSELVSTVSTAMEAAYQDSHVLPFDAE